MIYIICIVLFLFCNIYFGYLASKKIDSFDAFAKAGGNLAFIVVFFTLFSTYLGPGSSFGWVEKAYSTGLAVLPSIFGYIVFMAAMAFIAAERYNRFSRGYGASTFGDLMETRFDHRTRAILSIMQMGAFFAIAAAGMRAMGIIISSITPGLSLAWAIVLSSIVLIAYTAKGGLYYVAD